MAAISLVFTTQNLSKAAQALLKINNDFRHELLQGIGAEVESQTHRRLTDEKESPAGEEWQDLAPKTIDRIQSGRTVGGIKIPARPHSKSRILLDTGDMERTSLHYEVDGDTIWIGSDAIYAATHQFGDNTRNIPQREFLGISDKNNQEIQAIIDDVLSRHINSVITK